MEITKGAIARENSGVRDYIGNHTPCWHFVEHLESTIEVAQFAESFEEDVGSADIGDDSELGLAVLEEDGDEVEAAVLDHGVEEGVEGADGSAEAEGGDGKEDLERGGRAGGEGVSADEGDEEVFAAVDGGVAEGGEDWGDVGEETGMGEAEEDGVVGEVGVGEAGVEVGGVVEGAEGEERVGERTDDAGEMTRGETRRPRLERRSDGVGDEEVGVGPERGEMRRVDDRRRKVGEVDDGGETAMSV